MDVERAVAEYLGGDSLAAVARRHGCCSETVRKHLHRRGLSARSQGHHMLGNHNLWRGGRRVTSDGYIEIHGSLVEEEFKCMVGKRGYVGEHRLVMARYLGRPLTKREQVHHIDLNRENNAIENLQLRIGPHGSGAAFRCLDCGSSNITGEEI